MNNQLIILALVGFFAIVISIVVGLYFSGVFDTPTTTPLAWSNVAETTTISQTTSPTAAQTTSPTAAQTTSPTTAKTTTPTTAKTTTTPTVQTTSPTAAPTRDSMMSPECITNTCLTSPNNKYRACQQADGQFVVYDAVNNPIWKSGKIGTQYANGKLCMQDDGNLVNYANNTAYWNSTSANATPLKPYKAVMQDDGNFVIYTPVWNTNTAAPNSPTVAATSPTAARDYIMSPECITNACLTSPNNKYRACQQVDGQFVVYDAVNNPIWKSGKIGTQYANGKLCMQDDGNLVNYNTNNTPYWNSTSANATPLKPYKAVMQDDGNFVIYAPVWNTNTVGK